MMELATRPKIYTLPSYSLTGDLLGFLRCGLQYRYTRIGKLPSTRPVQLWFGEFIHGVLEEGYRRYKTLMAGDDSTIPPWDPEVIDEMRDLIKQRLAARGLFPWSPDLEELGDKRAAVCVTQLGPYLFPLIHRAEIRLTGARPLPEIESDLQFRAANRYEVVGIVDVVTHMELDDPALLANPIVQLIRAELPEDLPAQFEVIIDYKGMRRPEADPLLGHTGLWSQYAWQLKTYGELRRRQPDALPVVAGVLLYLNELHPTRSDIQQLKKELGKGTTDVIPYHGSDAAQILDGWSSKQDVPDLPFDFRLARALRIVPIDGASIAEALGEFDHVVKHIETCRGREEHGVPILAAWEMNSSDESTCTVCDYRTFCPAYQSTWAKKTKETKPRLPRVSTKS